jgi:molecular chaperone GrpE
MNDNDTPNDDNPTPATADATEVSDEATGLTPADGGTPSGPEDDARPDGVAELTRERDELRDMLLRRRAEFENFRRRTDREKAQWAADAEADVMQALVPTLDHLEQALQA